MGWFETAWETSHPLSAILNEYKKIKPIARSRTLEDTTEAGDLYAPSGSAVVEGELAVQLANARSLWVEVDVLYKNLGPSRPGNQLDLPRGTRVFFGFEPDAVALNTVLGYIQIKAGGSTWYRKSVRFGNNMMDKVNLPAPGTEGPATYDHKILLFERQQPLATGTPRFNLLLGIKADLRRWKASATHHVDFAMSSGRPYGLLF